VKYDAPRTVAFLQAYLREAVAHQPARTPQEELRSQVAPRSTSTAVTPPPVDPRASKVWTQQEIADFYRACIQGKFKSAQAEKERIEHEINVAVSEGRVR